MSLLLTMISETPPLQKPLPDLPNICGHVPYLILLLPKSSFQIGTSGDFEANPLL